MNISEYIFSAVRCLSASKMRTFLTTLGIIVGISSVILINTLGESLSKTIENVIYSLLSGNEVYIRIVPSEDNTDVEYDEYGYPIYDRDVYFDQQTIEEYDKMYEGQIERVLDFYEYSINGTIQTDSGESINVSASPVSPSYLNYNGLKIKEGRFVSHDDVDKSLPTIVIDQKVANKYFGGDALGKKLEIKSQDGNVYSLTVVGVLEESAEDVMMGMSSEGSLSRLYIPYTCGLDINQISLENFAFNYINYSIKNIEDEEQFKEDTEEYFDAVFEGTGFETEVTFLTDDLKTIDKIIDIITTVIAVIAAVSLLVGGIGVMNVMLVSVTERTMEIGVRKAMGAENKSICIQFIIESIIISLIGSVLGIIWGIMQSKILAIAVVKLTSDLPVAITVELAVPYGWIIGAVIFSFAVGIIFGVYPAYKASKMEVVDALRYE
ncbi:MAG: FtsX-like permease family protein [Ruminococcus sp.]|nr:FtsX-like permease family protein [Ruminococcus sp.]